MNKYVIRQSCLLFLTALIWGIAFVAQSAGMEFVGPFTFNAIRSLLGGIVLLPCIVLLNKWQKKEDIKEQENQEKRNLMMGGILCGILLFVASNLQQFGILYTAVGKAGFITALYIIIVPILGIFVHKKAGIKIWAGVMLALCGLYLLCMKGSFQLQKGDIFLLICAVCFAFHIIVIDYFSPKTDGVKMSCIQFFVCGILSAVCMMLWEQPKLDLILAAWLPLVYAGVMSCGVAYTLQIIGQKGMNPTVASMILSLESVISVLAGWVLLKQTLSARELAGCLLMFCAIILAQMPEKKKE